MVCDTTPTVLSLFSGAGGMDHGLEAAGFEHLGVIELDKVASDTLALNRPDWKNLAGGDVITAAKSLGPRVFGMEPGELDLLAGGPPCQPFSLAAQWAGTGKRGMLDPRAATVHATMGLIRQFLPKAVLMENVLGFVKGTHSALGYLTSEFDRISRDTGCTYRVEWKLVNAADYGVPQNRRRVMVVAVRSDISFEWPSPTHLDSPLRSWDAISDLEDSKAEPISGKWANLLPSIPSGVNYQWLTSRGGGDELFGYRTRYWNFLLKLAPELPSWTLAASPGPATGPFHWRNRALTTRERLRIQSFPDDWHLSGDLRQQTKQAGNATPPLLAETWGRALKSALGGRVESSSKLRVERTSRPLPVLPAPSPVPEEFGDLLGPKSSHAGTGLGPAPRSENAI